MDSAGDSVSSDASVTQTQEPLRNIRDVTEPGPGPDLAQLQSLLLSDVSSRPGQLAAAPQIFVNLKSGHVSSSSGV